MTARLTNQQTVAVSRVGGLVLTNALIFQEILAEHDTRIRTIQQVLNDGNPVSGFSDHWAYVLAEINYYPIFHVAREILASLTSRAEVVAAVCQLGATAQKVVAMRAALRHDLMGRLSPTAGRGEVPRNVLHGDSRRRVAVEIRLSGPERRMA